MNNEKQFSYLLLPKSSVLKMHLIKVVLLVPIFAVALVSCQEEQKAKNDESIEIAKLLEEEKIESFINLTRPYQDGPPVLSDLRYAEYGIPIEGYVIDPQKIESFDSEKGLRSVAIDNARGKVVPLIYKKKWIGFLYLIKPGNERWKFYGCAIGPMAGKLEIFYRSNRLKERETHIFFHRFLGDFVHVLSDNDRCNLTSLNPSGGAVSENGLGNAKRELLKALKRCH